MVYINTTGKHNEVWLDKPYATITVECPECPSTEDAYSSGYTDGSEEGYHKGYQSGSTDGWGAGYPSGYTDGVNSVICDDCTDFYNSGYTSGVTDGIAEQKAKLVATAITENGTYTREDGFSSAEVNVQEKKIDFSINPMTVRAGGIRNMVMPIGTTGCTLDPTRCTFIEAGDIINRISEVQGNPGSYYVQLDASANPTDVERFAYISGKFYDTDGNLYIGKPCVLKQSAGGESQPYNSGYTAGYDSGYTDGLSTCSGGNEDLIANLQGDYFIIPEGTTKLRDYAFYYASLSSITIPSSVTEIGVNVFNSSQLTGITIPSSIHTIKDGAFGSTKIREVTVPDTVSTLGRRVFAYCNYLTAATLPSGLTAIPNELFASSPLTGITLPTGITSIGSAAFQNCKLTGNIVIPSGVTSIDRYAFDNCSGLTSMIFESPVPATIVATSNWTTSLGSSAYTWPIYVPCEAVDTYKTAWPYYAHRIECNSGDTPVVQTIYLRNEEAESGKTMLLINRGTAIAEAELGDGTEIPLPEHTGDLVYYNFPVSGLNSVKYTLSSYTLDFSFAGCHHLVSVAVPSGVTVLSNRLFRACSILSAVTLPEGLLNIDTECFACVSNTPNQLTSITIPSTVTTIGANCFEYNTNLQSIVFKGTTPPTIESNSLRPAGRCVYYVPSSAVNAYKSAWPSLAADIQANPNE